MLGRKRGRAALLALSLAGGCYQSHERSVDAEVGIDVPVPDAPARCNEFGPVVARLHEAAEITARVGYEESLPVGDEPVALQSIDGALAILSRDDGSELRFRAVTFEDLEVFVGREEEPYLASVRGRWHVLRQPGALFEAAVMVRVDAPARPSSFPHPWYATGPSAVQLRYEPSCVITDETCPGAVGRRFVVATSAGDVIEAGESTHAAGYAHVAHVVSFEGPVTCGGPSQFHGVLSVVGLFGGD